MVLLVAWLKRERFWTLGELRACPGLASAPGRIPSRGGNSFHRQRGARHIPSCYRTKAFSCCVCCIIAQGDASRVAPSVHSRQEHSPSNLWHLPRSYGPRLLGAELEEEQDEERAHRWLQATHKGARVEGGISPVPQLLFAAGPVRQGGAGSPQVPSRQGAEGSHLSLSARCWWRCLVQEEPSRAGCVAGAPRESKPGGSVVLFQSGGSLC